MAECRLSKPDVEGSTPFTRSFGSSRWTDFFVVHPGAAASRAEVFKQSLHRRQRGVAEPRLVSLPLAKLWPNASSIVFSAAKP